MPRRYQEGPNACGPGQCGYFVTDRYRKNPPERQSCMRITSHVARRWCTVDGKDTGFDVACHIRPDDDRLEVAAQGGDRFVDAVGVSDA